MILNEIVKQDPRSAACSVDCGRNLTCVPKEFGSYVARFLGLD